MLFYVWEYAKAQPAGVLVLKTSQKTGPQLKESSDRLRELGMELGTRYKASDLSITQQQLTFCGFSLEVGWVYNVKGTVMLNQQWFCDDGATA